MGKWLVTCRAFILFICSACIQHFTLMSSISIFHHTWDGENKKSKYIEFITWLRNVKWTPERKKNPKWKNYQLIAHWALTLLSIVTAEKNEYFLYEQWIDNEFIQYKCRQIGRKKNMSKARMKMSHTWRPSPSTFNHKLKIENSVSCIFINQNWHSGLLLRLFSQSSTFCSHVSSRSHHSIAKCERKHITFCVQCQPMDQTETACASAYVLVWVSKRVCVCGVAMRPCVRKRWSDGTFPAKLIEQRRTYVAGCVVNTWKCISETSEPRAFVFDSAFFFSSSTLRLCVFFSFLSLPSDRCRRRHLISFVRALVFLARLPGFMLRSRPAQAHINAHHFSMHLYRFADLQCARPHSPEFRVFSFYSRQFLVWNNTCESATQVPRT